MLLSKYNNELTLKYNNISNNLPISINFSSPNSTVAFTIDICKLRLAPLDDISLVHIITSPTKVRILDIADLNDQKWLFISINLPNNCYKKGWVHENEVKFLIE